MKALQIDQPNQVFILDIPTPEPSGDEVLIKVMASGICGTDIHIYRGEYFGSYPVIPGHEFSGIVEKIGDKVTRFQVGDRVAVEPNISCDNCYQCLNKRQNFCQNWQAIGVTKPGGMAHYVVAPEKATFSIEDIAFEQGALMEPLSCVIYGLERVDVQLADKIALVGCGPIGMLFLQLLRFNGATNISVVEKQPSRAAMAEKYGADNIYTNLTSLTKDFYDVVIDATGIVSVMSQLIDYVRPEGKVLLFGVPKSGDKMNLDAFKFFQKGLSVLSSFTSLRNSHQAIELLQSGHLNVSDIVSHQLPLKEFTKGVELIENGLDNVKKVILLPQS